MVKETALNAIKIGSATPIHGELANVADEIPNKDAIGLAHTPTHAPLLQQANKIGAADVSPPVILVQIDFLGFIYVRLNLFTNTAKTAPMIGAKIYNHKNSQCPEINAGPIERTGFIEAPQIGPAK